jgi:hypothetical protein
VEEGEETEEESLHGPSTADTSRAVTAFQTSFLLCGLDLCCFLEHTKSITAVAVAVCDFFLDFSMNSLFVLFGSSALVIIWTFCGHRDLPFTSDK